MSTQNFILTPESQIDVQLPEGDFLVESEWVACLASMPYRPIRNGGRDNLHSYAHVARAISLRLTSEGRARHECLWALVRWAYLPYQEEASRAGQPFQKRKWLEAIAKSYRIHSEDIWDDFPPRLGAEKLAAQTEAEITDQMLSGGRSMALGPVSTREMLIKGYMDLLENLQCNVAFSKAFNSCHG